MFDNKAIIMIGGMVFVLPAAPVVITSLIGLTVICLGLYCILNDY